MSNVLIRGMLLRIIANQLVGCHVAKKRDDTYTKKMADSGALSSSSSSSRPTEVTEREDESTRSSVGSERQEIPEGTGSNRTKSDVWLLLFFFQKGAQECFVYFVYKGICLLRWNKQPARSPCFVHVPTNSSHNLCSSDRHSIQ